MLGRYSKTFFRLEGDLLKYSKNAKAKNFKVINLKESIVEID